MSEVRCQAKNNVCLGVCLIQTRFINRIWLEAISCSRLPELSKSRWVELGSAAEWRVLQDGIDVVYILDRRGLSILLECPKFIFA